MAVIERGDVGGVCVNTGTIPSKSMREAVVYLTGVNQHELYGASYRVKDRITWTDLHVRTEHVINREIDVIRSQLKRNGIEVSFVGATESELTKNSIPYEFGVSRYRELARGQIAGDCYGMLKLLASPEDHKLLGVHIFGTNATELVHIGQAVMGCGGTVDYLVDAVFNYPTFAETYKIAALDVMNKLRALEKFAG